MCPRSTPSSHSSPSTPPGRASSASIGVPPIQWRCWSARAVLPEGVGVLRHPGHPPGRNEAALELAPLGQRPGAGRLVALRLGHVGEVEQAAYGIDGVVELLRPHPGTLDVAVAVGVELAEDEPQVRHREVVHLVADGVVARPTPHAAPRRSGAWRSRRCCPGPRSSRSTRCRRRRPLDDLPAVAVVDQAARVEPTAAAQSCGSAPAAGGVPRSVNTSAPLSAVAASGRLKSSWVDGFVSPHG